MMSRLRYPLPWCVVVEGITGVKAGVFSDRVEAGRVRARLGAIGLFVVYRFGFGKGDWTKRTNRCACSER